MTIDELHFRLNSDLKSLNLPIDEVEVYFRPFSKIYYGRYFPSYREDVKPRIFIYPYKNTEDKLYDYNSLFDTLIHEMVHHLQYSDVNFKRKRGVMHDVNFWKLYNRYMNKAKERGIITNEVSDKDRECG